MKIGKLEIVSHIRQNNNNKWEFTPAVNSLFLISIVFKKTVLFILGYWG